MSIPRFTTPIRVTEAATGVQLAQAAGLWLRASRVGEPWRVHASDRVLVAFAGGTPVAVAEVQPTQFGTLGIGRFRAALGHDAEGLRAQLIDFAGGASNVGRSSYRPLAA